MRRLLVAAAVLTVMLVPVIASAQTGNFDIRYNPQTVQTITGTVQKTIDYDPSNPATSPKGVVVSCGGQCFTVFLGPGCYVDQVGLSLKPGDQVTVVASRRDISCGTFYVASTVTMCDKCYTFRSECGTVMWPNACCKPVAPCGTTVAPSTCPPVGAGPCATCPPAVVPPCNTCPPAATAPCTTCPPVGTGPCATCPPVATAPCATCPSTSIGPCPAEPVCPAAVGCGPCTALSTVPFNPDDIITVSGKIVSISQVQTPESNDPILQVVTVPDTGYSRKSVVLLGPACYLAQNGIAIAPGNSIFVRGSLTDTPEGKMVVATDVKEGNQPISLRTINGIPVWPAANMPGSSMNPVIY